MVRKIEVDEYVERAEKIAAANGGFLPTMSKLSDMREISVLRAIRADRSKFEHLLSKQGRGRDKIKYAYVEAHIDEDDEKLARDLDVSKPTVRNWKNEIRESGLMRTDAAEPPAEVAVADMVKFILKSIPEDWSLDLSFKNGGCFITLIQPNGARRDVASAYGKPVIQSIMIHVNHARVKSGLPEVGLPD